jgi:hypothetical protein
MSASNYVHLDNCDVIRETENAFLIRYEGEEIWIPRSQLADADDYAAGDEDVTLSVTEWIAKQKGIEVD